MNQYTESAKCLHGMHSQCCYEDCACPCHIEDWLAIPYPPIDDDLPDDPA